MVMRNKKRLKKDICKQCGEYRPIHYLKEHICKRCYERNYYYKDKQKQLNRNKKFIKNRVAQGICQHCGSRPIDYQRSRKFCSFCLDYYKKKSSERFRNLKEKNICTRCGREKIDNTISSCLCRGCKNKVSYLKKRNNIILDNEINEVRKYLEKIK